MTLKNWRDYPEDMRFSEMVLDCWKCGTPTTSKLIYWGRRKLDVVPLCDKCMDTEMKHFQKGSELAPYGIDAIVKNGKFKSLRRD